jgi:hypothetical protein
MSQPVGVPIGATTQCALVLPEGIAEAHRALIAPRWTFGTSGCRVADGRRHGPPQTVTPAIPGTATE